MRDRERSSDDLRSAAHDLSEALVRLIEAFVRQEAKKFQQEQAATAEPKDDRMMFLRMPAVLARSGYSKSALYNAMGRGEFPRPRKRGGQAVWIESEVNTALKQHAETLPVMSSSEGARPRRRRKSSP